MIRCKVPQRKPGWSLSRVITARILLVVSGLAYIVSSCASGDSDGEDNNVEVADGNLSANGDDGDDANESNGGEAPNGAVVANQAAASGASGNGSGNPLANASLAAATNGAGPPPELTANDTKPAQVAEESKAAAEPPLDQAPPPPLPSSPATDLVAAKAVLHWVGFDYLEREGLVRVEVLTKGQPKYDLLQEQNRASQPEIVLRLHSTTLRHKLRRDINASEFRSPVAFIRLREEKAQGHVDIVMTMRDPVEPRLFAKGGNVLLTFAIPDRYFGNTSVGDAPIARAELLPSSHVIPEADGDSDPPEAMRLARLATANPAVDAFKNAPADGGSKVNLQAPAGAATAGGAQQGGTAGGGGLPPDFGPGGGPSPSASAAPSAAATSFQQDVGAAAPPAPSALPSVGGSGGAPPPKPLNPLPAPAATPTPAAGGDELDGDLLDNFDEGDGDTSKNIEKFNVQRASGPAPTVVANFSIVGVAQDDGGLGGASPGPSNATLGNPSATPDFPGANAALPSGAEGAGANLLGTNAGQPTAEKASLKGGKDAAPGEPPLSGNPDLAGQEQEGQAGENGAPPASAGGRPMKLDFRGAPLTEVIRVLSEESHVNFVIPPTVGSLSVYIDLQNVPFNDALKAVLESNALGMVSLGPNLVRIDTLDNLAKAKESEQRRKQAELLLRPTKILVHRLSYAKASEAAAMLGKMLGPAADTDKRITVQVDNRTNAIIVNAPPAELATVKALLERLDLETPQVKIASRIVEVLKKFSDSFGLTWGGPFNLDQGRGLGFGNLVYPNYALSRYSVDAGGTAAQAGNLQFRLGSINNSMAFDAALSMEESRGTTEVLQSSNLIVEDNQDASIIAGSTDYFRPLVPNGAVIQGSSQGLESVQYNLNMTVKPHVTAEGAVQMSIKVRSDTPSAPSAAGAAAAKDDREVNTILTRRSGETIVIGGLYNTTHSEGNKGVPILSHIPIIGALFRSHSSTEQKRELMVLVTPTILTAAKSGGGEVSPASSPTASPALAAAPDNGGAKGELSGDVGNDFGNATTKAVANGGNGNSGNGNSGNGNSGNGNSGNGNQSNGGNFNSGDGANPNNGGDGD